MIEHEEIPITILWPSYKLYTPPEAVPPPKKKKAIGPAEEKTTKVGPIKPLIRKALAERGPAGVDGIAKAAGLEGKQVNPRLHAMMEAGQIRLTGRMVASAAGGQQREWEIVPALSQKSLPRPAAR